jgi:hypothetical protein
MYLQYPRVTRGKQDLERETLANSTGLANPSQQESPGWADRGLMGGFCNGSRRTIAPARQQLLYLPKTGASFSLLLLSIFDEY